MELENRRSSPRQRHHRLGVQWGRSHGIHSDHLGSTSATSGASLSTQTYFAYGAIRLTTGTVPTDYGFTGQRRDASAGLMDYGARFYDPGLGRFTQPDTIIPNLFDPQSLNRYAYVLNNPVRYTDPTGHMAEDDEGGGGGGGSSDTEHASEEDTIVVTPKTAGDYYPPAAETNGDQTPNDHVAEDLHDEVERALENIDPDVTEGEVMVEMFAKGYDPTSDPRFASFSEFDQGNLSFTFQLYRWQQMQNMGIKPSSSEILLMLSVAGVAATKGDKDSTPADQLMPGGRPIGRQGSDVYIREMDGEDPAAWDLFNSLTKNGTENTPRSYKNGVMFDVEGGTVGIRSSESYGTILDVNIPGVPFGKIHFPRR